MSSINREDMEPQHLKIPSISSELPLVEKMIDSVCLELHLKEAYYGNILVAITEAVNNAILHGNKNDSNKWIEIMAKQLSDNRLEFVIKDEGNGFDFNSLPDPTSPENIEKEHGRGVFLMKNLADSIDFEDHGKTVKLTFNISKN